MIKRKKALHLALIFAFSFVLGFSYNYHLPKLESFLLVEIERLSQQHSPLGIFASKLSFHLFPLGVVLEDVRILAKPPLNKYLAPARLKEAGARLAIWPLLRGEVRLSQVFIRDSELNIFLKQDLFENKSGNKSFKLDFDQIYKLPIDEVVLEKVQIQGRLDPQNVVFRIAEMNLSIENRYQSLFVEVQAPRVLVKPSGPVDPLNVQLDLRALFEAEEAQISAFKLKANDSYVVASGRFNGNFSTGRLDNGAFDARTHLLLPDLNIWEKIFFLQPRLPSLSGSAEMDLGIELRQGKGYRYNLDLKTADVKISKFVVGNVKGQIASDLKTTSSDLIEIENSAGKAKFRNVKLQIEPKPTINANVSVDNVELQQLLLNLGLKKAPLYLPVTGDATCEGGLKDPLEINCTAAIKSQRVHVWSDKGKSTIVDVGDLRSQGSVKINSQEVSYKADLQVGKNSHGSSVGTINYEDGFKINYVGDNVDFSDVKNLANLKFEGAAKITGNTEGTAHWATIAMEVDAKRFWLEDYPLGDLSAKVNYKSGLLTFKDIQGQYQVSRYNGDVAVDLLKDRLQINAQIPFADLHDIQSMFERKIQLPFVASGTGTGQIEASGPFAFRQMTYKVKSSFFRGEIARETFDELVFNVHSVDGHVSSDRIHLTKSSGTVDVNGQISPSGDIDTVVVARALRLEQSENVLGLGLDLQGLADITMLIRGQLPKPRIELNGRLSRVVLGDRPAEDSVFKLNFLQDRVEGSGQFLGSTLLTNFIFPYNDQAPFLFDLKTKKWDFTTAFSLVSKSARQLDFDSSVSMDLKLEAPSGGFWASSGDLSIDEFSVRKGGKQMIAEKPMRLNMRNGVINSNNFSISSGDSYLKLDVVNLRKDFLNASVNGKLDLSLLGLFTPFISDLRGYMSLSMDFRGSVLKPSVSGSAYVERGYAKFTDFYHPFSNVRADILFNDNQILLNSVRADMAGGKLSGDGKISFEGQNRPIDIRGTFSEVKLNIPDGFHTRGSGTVAIRGPQFPYTMDINYQVSGGEITYEFGDPVSDDQSVKASAYLPRFLYQEAFHPFTFLVDVNLKTPVMVNNSLVQAQVSGQVKAAGVPDRLILDGTLTPAVGGKVFFRDTPFEITSGYVEYDKMPPDNPRIYLTANTRVSETVQDEQQRSTEHHYDVSMLVQGRAKPPQITLNSQPPLNQREIVSLLALGVTGTSMDNSTSEEQATNTSSAVGAAILQKAGGRRLKDSLGVDVKVSSSQPTTDNASRPKVTLSKQWTPKFGASASSTLQANPSNQVKLEYKMNKNLSVIGSWDGKETNPENTASQNVFGLDLEYKVQFK